MKKLIACLFGLLFSIPAFATLPQQAIDAGYTEVEYISTESAYGPYIDTGLTAGSNTRILARYKLDNLGFSSPISARDENTAGAGFGIGLNGSQQFISDYNGDRKTFTITPNTTDIITVDKNKNVCTITIGGQSETVTNTASTFTTTNTLPFFAQNSVGTTKAGKYIFYSFKMWNNDVLVLDLVPVKKTVNGTDVYGMYNVLDSNPETAFYGNKGTGAFTGGDPVAQTPTNSGPISSVTVSGLVAQNGTPSPATPVAINTNNGVLKVSKNLFDGNITNWAYQYISSANRVSTSSSYRSIVVPVTAGQTYTFSRQSVVGNRFVYFFTKDVPVTGLEAYNVNSNLATSTLKTTFTVPAEMKYVVFYFSISGDDISGTQMQIEKGSTATAYHPYGEVYVEGTAETITDSANHTANVATLLGVGDYHDTQNINTGAITRNVGIKVLDGTEDWTQTDSYSNPWVFYTTFSDGKSGSGTLEKVYCTHFQGVAETNPNMPPESAKITVQGTSPTISRFYVKTAAASTIELWKAYLAAQYAAGTPVIVIYPKATATNESVTAQTLTTAPVSNKTGGVTGMTITTLLSSGASVVTTIADLIKIATTKYNNTAFGPVVTALSNAVDTIKTVVANTINQATAVANLHSGKQTMPNSTATNGTCPNYRQCLLVEDNQGNPYWYEIMDPFYNLFSAVIPNNVGTESINSVETYTQLEYIESRGSHYIDTGITSSNRAVFTMSATEESSDTVKFIISNIDSTAYTDGFGLLRRSVTGLSGSKDMLNKHNYDITYYTTGMSVIYDNEPASTMTMYKIADNKKIVLFGGTATNRRIIAKLYSLKLYNNDNLVRDYVPARRERDGRTGLYDKVSGDFFPNAASTTANFVAGPDVANTEIPATQVWSMTFLANAPLDARYMVNGSAVCNATSGTANTAATSTQMSANNWTATGSNCWCSIDMVTELNHDNSSTGKNIWVWLEVPSGETCAGDCASNCADAVASGAAADKAFRQAMTGM